MQPEIRLAIENEKRRAALQNLTADLLRRAENCTPAAGFHLEFANFCVASGRFCPQFDVRGSIDQPPSAFDFVCSAQLEKLLE